jgi:hypothetical protein
MPLVGQQAAAHVQGTHALEHSAAQRLAALRWMAWAATAAWRFVAAAREWDLCVCWLTAAQALEMLEALPTNIFKPTIAEQVGE